MARAESDSKVVRQILNELQIDRCLPSAVFRLGRQRQPGSKPRPLKILFPCSAAVNEALRNKKKLVGKFKNIVVRKSLTKQELEERSKLIDLCKQKRESTKLDYVVYAGISPPIPSHTQTDFSNNIVLQNPSLNSPNLSNVTSHSIYSKFKSLKNISCIYQNCRSIRNKINELDIQIVDLKPDLVLLSETWLEDHDTHLTQLNSSKNFHIVIANRDRKFKSKGGGVAMLIRKGISYKQLPFKNIVGIELIAVDISVTSFKDKIRLILVYRPPNTASSLINKLLKNLQNLCENNVIIVGDFNFSANNINWDNNTALTKCGKEFLEFVTNFKFSNIITSPTHNKGSILDLLLTNNPTSICSSQIDAGLSTSDHFSILFTLKLEKPKPQKIYYRDYSNLYQLNSYLISNFNLIYEKFYISDKYEYLIALVSNLMKEYTPLRTATLKPKSIYYPLYIRKLIKHKKGLFKQSLKQLNILLTLINHKRSNQ
uniref:Endonuclease/exonuclease/phosphatase domain-containing protein n=1 Tax=Meloidogyne enterolobii TaxID=390850 RepID=A0A6V7V1Y4_MELEN|nr:unnamed protein product [Meloidogyne enterolobii]